MVCKILEEFFDNSTVKKECVPGIFGIKASTRYLITKKVGDNKVSTIITESLLRHSNNLKITLSNINRYLNHRIREKENGIRNI